MKKHWREAVGSVTLVAFAATTFLNPFGIQTAQAVGPAATLRQEVNVTDAYYYAPSGSFATSSEIANIDPTKYSGTVTYYFEVEASTTSATNATIRLVNASTGASLTSVTANGTAYALYRSSSFTPPAAATDYTVQLGNESVGKGIKSARIIIAQSIAGTANSDATSTETQIEIGDNETYSDTATSTFASPKYWNYNSANWDGSLTTYAEITYAVVSGVASTTNYTTSGTFTVALPGGSASTSVALWGAGGDGGGAALNPGSGGGGAGGQFASSTLLATTTNHTLVVAAATAAAGAGLAGTKGASTTWDGAVVLAAGGKGGGVDNNATTTGNTIGCVGQICNAGGSGSAGNTATYGGAGGGGAGTTGAGGNAGPTTQPGSGTAAGGTWGAPGSSNNIAGVAATSTGGGGGSGAHDTVTTDKAGGGGAQGQAIITNYIASSTVVLQSDDGAFGTWTDVAGTYLVNTGSVTGGVPTRIRTAAFTPVTAKHYRIAFSKGDIRTTIAIYDAKIIVDTLGGNVLLVAETGSGKWSVPAGITSVTVKSWGAGCGGGGHGASGDGGSAGGGGAYSELDTFAVTPTTQISFSVGIGGTAGQSLTTSGGAGGDSMFSASSTLLAAGCTSDGTGGGGLAASGNGTVTTSGGDGANGTGVSGNDGAGSGGSGGDTTSGGNGVHGTTGAGGTAGTAGTTNGAAGVIGGVGGSNGNNGIIPGGGASGSGHTGSFGGVGARGEVDIYNPLPLFTKIEPQYVLAPSPLAAGTALQVTLSTYDPAEWSGASKTFYEDVDSAAGSASEVTISNTPNTQVYATVSSPSSETSAVFSCIPASKTTLDSTATTNNGDVYSVRILVDVVVGSSGGTSTNCSGPAPVSGPVVVVKAQVIINKQTIIE